MLFVISTSAAPNAPWIYWPPFNSLTMGDGKFTSEQVANLWVARDDAWNYIVHGDPAVRLRVKDKAATPIAT